MANAMDPVKVLATARDKLVEERRALAVAIALGHRRRRTDDPQTNEMREGFLSIQNVIESIDRAMADEKVITSFRSESSLAPILEVVSPEVCLDAAIERQ
jgi:hypothetical protein